jgi:GR25 family glycosyltransferase involved in LPS biosynthesis
MILDEIAPFKICVNLPHRHDRRVEAWQQFDQLGISVLRFPAIPSHRIKSTWGYRSPSRYACSLSKRLAIRSGKLAGASAVLLMEDDVVLAEDLHERLECIELPEDWGIFFLGCKHLEPPIVYAPGLVRVTRAADHHAMIVRREFIGKLLVGLAGISKNASPEIPYSDVKMSDIQHEIPTYACYPNLAWQKLSHSNNAERKQTHYNAQGIQLTDKNALVVLDEEIRREYREEWPSLPRALTNKRSSLILSDPITSQTIASSVIRLVTKHKTTESVVRIPSWRFLVNYSLGETFEQRYPLAFYINLSRREDRRTEVEYQFSIQGISVERLVAADGNRARNTRGHGKFNQYACRLSHRMAIRQARIRNAPCVLIFEDDVVLHPYFRDILERLEPPKDWGVLFFGATHVEAPEVVAPGWVKISSLWGLQAYVVKNQWYEMLLKALRRQGCPNELQGADVILSNLSSLIPMYATYPNIAWQGDGYSDLMSKLRAPFCKDGQQNQFIAMINGVNEAMRHRIACEYGDDVVEEKNHTFLQPRDVFQSGPEKWTLEQEFPLRLCINLKERSDRRQQANEQFAKINLPVEFFPAVDGRRKNAIPKPGVYGCALSHILALRRAWQSGVKAVLLFEDDVMLHKNLRYWAQSIVLPDDWGILYFGNQHEEPPIVCRRGMVRTFGSQSTHAYAVKREAIPKVMHAMRLGLRDCIPCDVVLMDMQKQIPSYGFYPNLAWQRDSYSNITGKVSCYFESDGVQRQLRKSIHQVDHDMKALIGSFNHQ